VTRGGAQRPRFGAYYHGLSLVYPPLIAKAPGCPV
jgi:hypothetical protein